jgi:hypothetical protein
MQVTEAQPLGLCDRSDCTQTPTHYVLGHPWGVPLICDVHAEEERTLRYLKVLPIEEVEPPTP